MMAQKERKEIEQKNYIALRKQIAEHINAHAGRPHESPLTPSAYVLTFK